MLKDTMEKVVVKYFMFMMFFFVIPLCAAQVQTLGTFTVNQDINLSQVCATCTYVNLQKVKLPDSSEIFINTNMTKEGQTYYYTFSNTAQLGQYIVTTCGDLAGQLQCTNYDLYVTSNGQSFSSSQSLALLPIVALIAILFAIGYTFSREKWKMKSFFYLASLLATVILINSTLIMFSTSTSLQSMGEMALILGLVIFLVYTLYIFVYYLIEIFNQIKDVKERRRRLSDPY